MVKSVILLEPVFWLYNEGEERGWSGYRVEEKGLLYEEILGMLIYGNFI